MQIYKDVPITKFKGFQRHEPIAPSSSAIMEYKKCPRAFFFRYVLGYTEKESKIYFAWGNAVHKFYEVADKTFRSTNGNADAGIAFGLVAAMKEWGDTKDPSPDDKKFGFMTKARLSDTIMKIGKEWMLEKSNSTRTVIDNEMTFNLQMPHGQWTSGKIDEFIEIRGKPAIEDTKTTTKKWQWYKRQLNPSDQFMRYLWAGQQLTKKQLSEVHVRVIYTTKDEGPKIHRELIMYSPDQVNEWLRDHVYWSKAIDSSREQDNYPKNEKQCNFCQFREICITRGEASQIFVLKSKYKFEPYDNAKSNEDI
jgi:CRISPR/Cas system-associated exonuclease Cas4 (RecB family)